MFSKTSHIRQVVIEMVFLVLLISILAISCSNDRTGTAPIATASEAAALNLTATMFPSLTAVNTTAVTPIPLSTQLPQNINTWNFRVAYVTSQNRDNKLTTQLWIIEPPYQVPRLILSMENDNALSNYVLAWSQDGRQIAFSHFIKGKSEAISIVDIFSLKQQELFSIAQQPYGSGSSEALEVSSSSWSPDDQWLAVTMRYIRSANDTEQKKVFILSATHKQTFELDDKSEFVSWMPKTSDQFLYLIHPQYPSLGNETVHIGKVGEAEPVNSISNLGRYAPLRAFDLSISPDGNRVISVSFEGNLRTFISLLELQKSEWKLLPYIPEGISEPGLWSPNGEWLTFWQGADIYFWKFNQAGQPEVVPLPQADFVSSAIWAPDSSKFIYQDGKALYAVDPSVPQKPSLILDLNALGIKSDEEVITYIWMPSLS